MNKTFITFLILLLAVPALCLAQQAMSSASYKIESDSLNSGGARSVSATYGVEDSAGEVSTGRSQSSNSALFEAGYQGMRTSIAAPTHVPPSVPTGVNATAVSPTSVDLTWDASTDDYRVAGYYIYREGAKIAQVAEFPREYLDNSLTAATAYSYAVSAFDEDGNESASSSPVSVTTLSAAISATPGGQHSLLENFAIVPDSNSALVTFTTQAPVVARIAWGADGAYGSGSISDHEPTLAHRLLIPGLDPHTRYFVRLSLIDQSGTLNFENISFLTLKVSNTIAPPNVTALTASPNGDSIALSWHNPSDPTMTAVRIVRSTVFYPSDVTDGTTVFSGEGTSFVDKDVEAGTTYYYIVFSVDQAGNLSSGSIASAKLLSAGETATPTQPLENLPAASHVDPMIDALTLKDFLFIQHGDSVPVTDVLSLDGRTNTTVALKYYRVPQVLKTIAVTLSTKGQNPEYFTFVLRANRDKTRYEATIGPLGDAADYAVRIHIIDFKNQGMKTVSGGLHVVEKPTLAIAPLPIPQALASHTASFVLLILLGLILMLFVVLRVKLLPKSAIAAGSVAFFFIFLPSFAHAAINPEINYQGRLVDGANVAVTNGSYNMRFNLYTTATGGSSIWTETLTGSNKVPVTSGLFSLMLGSTTPFTGVDFNQTLYLGVEIGGTGVSPTWDGEMIPRKIIGAVPAAFVADTLDGLDSSYFLANSFSTTSADAYLGTKTSDNLTEGSTNKFFTQGNFDTALAATTTLNNLAVLRGITDLLATRATITSATTTSLFATTASSTNLFATNATFANLFGTTANLTESGSNLFYNQARFDAALAGTTTLNNLAVLKGLTDLIGIRATVTNATTTSIFSTTASSTNLFATNGNVGVLTAGSIAASSFTGAGLSACSNANNALIWSSGMFGCNTITGGGGSGTDVNWSFFNNSGIRVATTTNQVLIGASSTSTLSKLEVVGGISFDNATGTSATTTNFFATTASSTNLFTSLLQVGANALVVNAAGNVGIGTASPSFKLDVNGSINIAAGQAFSYNGASIIRASTTKANYFFGAQAGNLSMTGTSNVGIGSNALLNNTTGVNNTGLGTSALQNNTTGIFNTAQGAAALFTNTTGGSNTAVGDHTLFSNLTGGSNTALGYRAGLNITSGSNNLLLGYQAGDNLTTGSNNIILGYDIDAQSATQTSSLNIGNAIFGSGINGTGSTLSTATIGIGTTTPQFLLQLASSSAPQLALSDGSLTDNHWTLRNAGGVLYVATSSASTFATSTVSALTIDTNGTVTAGGNINLSSGALSYQIGGTSALRVNTSAQNTYVGITGSATCNGIQNTVIGNNAVIGCAGSGITAVGNAVMQGGVAGDWNTGVGDAALIRTTGQANTALGAFALDGVSNGSNNIGIGYHAGYNTDGSSNILIGASVDAANLTGSSQLNIGNLLYGDMAAEYAGLGTTTPRWLLQLASSSAPQLALSDGSLTDNHWTLRNAGGALYFATASPSTFATSSKPAFAIDANGHVGIGDDPTSNFPQSALYIAPSGTDNALHLVQTGGQGIAIDDLSDTASLFITGTLVDQSLTGSTILLSKGALESQAGTYTDAGHLLNLSRSNTITNAGASLAVSGAVAQISDDCHAFFSSTCTSTANVLDLTQSYSANTGNVLNITNSGRGNGLKISSNGTPLVVNAVGNVGLGTTTPQFLLQLASSTAPQLALSDGSLTDNHWTLRNAGGYLYFATASPSTFATSSATALTIDTSGKVIANCFSTDGSTCLSTGSSASSTLLSDNNTFSGSNTFTGATILNNVTRSTTTNATTTSFFTTTASSTNLFASTAKIGANALVVNSAGNVSIGQASPLFKLDVNGDINFGGTSGVGSIYNGGLAVLTASTTNLSTLVGIQAGNSVTTAGTFNTLIGYQAGFSETSATNNTSVGYSALFNSTASNNTALGSQAGYTNTTGSSNVFIGYNAGELNTTGSQNALIGFQAGINNGSATSTTALGYSAAAGSTNYHAQNLTAIGTQALNAIITGADDNTALGFQAGNAVSSGAKNILIGSQAASNLTTGSQNIILGYNINALTASVSNRLNIGNAIFGSGINGTGSTLSTATIGIGTTTPQFLLQLASSSAPQLALSDGSLTDNHWTLRNAGGYLYFATASPSTFATSSATALTINTNGNVGIGYNSPSAALAVNGRIGAGTSNPSNTLSVFGGMAEILGSTLTTSPTVTGGSTGSLILSASGGEARIQAFNSAVTTALTFHTQSAPGGATIERLRISPGGNIGVGTTSPYARLSIHAGATDTYMPSLFSIASSTASYATSTLFAVLANGNVGIGVDTPNWTLQVASATPYIALTDTDAATDKKHLLLSNLDGVFRVGTSSDDLSSTSTAFSLDPSGPAQFGLGTSTPWKTLAVTGTVGFDGLTGATGAGSLCLSASKEVVYNSGSDSCLSSLRSTKHSITPLTMNALDMINALEPVSFIYNTGATTTRYGFIADDASAVDTHFGTYDANGNLSGIDDRALLSVAIKSIQELENRVASSASSATTSLAVSALTQAVGLDINNISAGLDIHNGVVIHGGLKIDHIAALTDVINLESDVNFIGRPYFNSDTGGLAVVEAGQRQVDVAFDKPYIDAPVVSATITLDASTTDSDLSSVIESNPAYIVAHKSGNGFSIILSKPAVKPVTFSWIALAIKNMKVADSASTTQPVFSSSVDTTIITTPVGQGNNPPVSVDASSTATSTPTTTTTTDASSTPAVTQIDTASSTPVVADPVTTPTDVSSTMPLNLSESTASDTPASS